MSRRPRKDDAMREPISLSPFAAPYAPADEEIAAKLLAQRPDAAAREKRDALAPR